MFERFAEDVRLAVLEAAEEVSTRRGDPRLGTEHLLVGAVYVGDPVTEAFGLSADDLRSRLAEWDVGALQAVGIDADVDVPPPPVGRRRGLLPLNHVRFNRGAKQALKRAAQICLDQGHRTIQVSHLLAALALGGRNDPAVRLLRASGVEPAELDAEIRRGWQAA